MIKNQQPLFVDQRAPNLALDQYFTPPSLVREFWQWVGKPFGLSVLEPSAGIGSLIPREIVDVANFVCAIEIDPAKAKLLHDVVIPGRSIIIEGNFLEHDLRLPRYDLAPMNPPYSTSPAIDARFVRRASEHATRVCAIVRSVFMNGVDRKVECHDHVIYSRVRWLARRPQFGGEFGAKTDFMFVECRKRMPGEKQEDFPVEMTTG